MDGVGGGVEGQIITSKYTYANLSNESVGFMDVPTDVMLEDSRTLKDFKVQVLGGYSKIQVLASFDKAIKEEKCDHALYWCIQMLCSGGAVAMWERLIGISAKYINLLNPNLPSYLMARTREFNKIVSQLRYKGDSCLSLRNNGDIRVLLAEFTIICATSRHGKLESLPTIKKTDFMVEVFKGRLEAKDTTLSGEYMKPEDPSEIRIAGNELAFHLHHHNLNKALYWLSWICEWAKLNTKKYGKFEIGIRAQNDIDAKFYRLWCWLPWNIIVGLARRTAGTQLNSEIVALWELYKLDFTSSHCSRKQFLMIWAMKLLCQPCDWKIKLIEREPLLFKHLMNINAFFKTVKTQCQALGGGATGGAFNIVIQDNYKKPPAQQQASARQPKASKPKIPEMTDSMRKQQTLFSLDKYSL